MDSLTSVISHGVIRVSRDINISWNTIGLLNKKKYTDSSCSNSMQRYKQIIFFFQSKIFTVVKPNLFELITKDWVKHANEKINYAKHMVSKSLPQQRWQGLFKYLKKIFAQSPCAMRKASCCKKTFTYFYRTDPFGYWSSSYKVFPFCWYFVCTNGSKDSTGHYSFIHLFRFIKVVLNCSVSVFSAE